VGAQLFSTVNSDMPAWAGIIVIALATLILCAFGYNIVHMYERISWIPCLIIFLIVLGQFAHSGDFQNVPMVTGKAGAGGVLSFAASVFGFCIGWASFAADYSVYQPVTTKRRHTFMWTYAGLAIPLLFLEMLGAAVAAAAATHEAYYDAYENHHIGGLLGQVLIPRFGRFGHFCLVVLALSIIANNCPNIYSVGLTLQMLGDWTRKVPRFLWTVAGTGAYIAIAIPGANSFESVLENFMLMIAYWLAIYTGISFVEHIFYKRGFGGYDMGIYMDASKLPPGIAALAAFACGVAGVVIGMAQVWWVGPIAKLCGDPEFGGDIGFELAFGFSSVSYFIFRRLEIKYFGR
jgi:NCS1 nucleoside transporter family